jgi:hypothetical protein
MNTDGAINNGQPIATGNTGHSRRRTTTQKKCLGHHYTQTRHGPSYKQLEAKTNRTSFVCRNQDVGYRFIANK